MVWIDVRGICGAEQTTATAKRVHTPLQRTIYTPEYIVLDRRPFNAFIVLLPSFLFDRHRAPPVLSSALKSLPLKSPFASASPSNRPQVSPVQPFKTQMMLPPNLNMKRTHRVASRRIPSPFCFGRPALTASLVDSVFRSATVSSPRSLSSQQSINRRPTERPRRRSLHVLELEGDSFLPSSI